MKSRARLCTIHHSDMLSDQSEGPNTHAYRRRQPFPPATDLTKTHTTLATLTLCCNRHVLSHAQNAECIHVHLRMLTLRHNYPWKWKTAIRMLVSLSTANFSFWISLQNTRRYIDIPSEFTVNPECTSDYNPSGKGNRVHKNTILRILPPVRSWLGGSDLTILQPS